MNQQVQGSTNFDRLRHRWEMPLIWASVVTTAATLLGAAALLSMDQKDLAPIFGDYAADVLDYAQTALLLLALPVYFFLARFYMIAMEKSNAIRVGPNQMPKLWAMYVRLCDRLDMPKPPRLYVVNGNGVVNAYAMSCNARLRYVVVHAEIAMLIDSQPEAVEFVLAHELGHHKLRHVSLWRIVVGVVPGLVPVFGVSTTRAQEYSADRVALKVCDHPDACMKLLGAGPWMVPAIDSDALHQQCQDEHREVFVRLANLFSDHAVLVKRYKALKDIQEKGYGAQGEMF